MARYLGEIVHYVPHNDHDHLKGQTEYAGIVGQVYPDGSADIMIFPPNRPAEWVDKVPEGDAHHTHRSIPPQPLAPEQLPPVYDAVAHAMDSHLKAAAAAAAAPPKA